jgi:hypothetical protein
MEVLNERLRICHAKKRVIAKMIEITTKGLRSVHSNISLNEKRIGIPFRIIQQLSCDGKEKIKCSEEKKNNLD